uniref:Uncharacterized protein n=1 Tax=uncultured bacterium A1Q1_fos_2107 TaxID=1256562 RepID=L7VU97_9BACT|nr:hypothetical protein [uncultured bacterium A1Q1_fos_2107]
MRRENFRSPLSWVNVPDQAPNRLAVISLSGPSAILNS